MEDVRVMKHLVNLIDERQILTNKQHNFHSALQKHLAEQADQTMKDVYMLGLLGITEPVVEAKSTASTHWP